MEVKSKRRYSYLTSRTESTLQTTTSHANENSEIDVPKKSYQVYNIFSKKSNANSDCSNIDSQGSILFSIYNNTNGRCTNNVQTHNTEESMEMGNAWIQPRTSEVINSDIPIPRRITWASSSVNEVRNLKAKNESFLVGHQINDQINSRSFSTPPFNTGNFSILPSQLRTTSEIGESRRSNSSLYNFKGWARIYLFGSEQKTGISPIQ